MATSRKPDSVPEEEATGDPHAVLIGLSAAIVSVAEERPRVLVVHRDGADALPFGTFDPLAHRTLESGLRGWVEEQTRLQLGYVEQLYTFGDRGRHLTRADVRSGRATRLVIDAAQPIPVQVDGDPWGTTPVEIEIVPGGLVLVAAD